MLRRVNVDIPIAALGREIEGRASRGDPDFDVTRIHRQHRHIGVRRSKFGTSGLRLQQRHCLRSVRMRVGPATTASLHGRQLAHRIALAKDVARLVAQRDSIDQPGNRLVELIDEVRLVRAVLEQLRTSFGGEVR